MDYLCRDQKVVIIGAGGHARVLLDALLLQKCNVLAMTDIDPSLIGTNCGTVPIIAESEFLNKFKTKDCVLVNGVGAVDYKAICTREQIYKKFTAFGHRFGITIHPSAIISSTNVSLKDGAQILAGAIIQTGAIIGENCIVNTGAIVEHDCVVGDHSHIAPGALLCGMVSVEERCLIGARSVVKQGLNIKSEIVVGMGSVVLQDLVESGNYVGILAKKNG